VSLTSGDLSGTSYPVDIFVGRADGAPTLNITPKVPLDSLVIEETGTHEEAIASFSIIDKALAYAALRGEWKVLIVHQGDIVFRGYIGRPRAEIAAIYGEQAVTCRDIGSLLDRLVIKSVITRSQTESDKARIQWLINTIGQPLVAEGMTDWRATRPASNGSSTPSGNRWWPRA